MKEIAHILSHKIVVLYNIYLFFRIPLSSVCTPSSLSPVVDNEGLSPVYTTFIVPLLFSIEIITLLSQLNSRFLFCLNFHVPIFEPSFKCKLKSHKVLVSLLYL